MATTRTTKARAKDASVNEPEVERKVLPEQDLCRRIYETMVLMRATDDRLVALYRQGQLPAPTTAATGTRPSRWGPRRHCGTTT